MSDKTEKKKKGSNLAKRESDALSKKEPSGGAKAASVFFGACLVASIGVGFILKEVTGVVAIAAPAFLVAMAFTRLDLFDYIKGAGVELKLRAAEKAVEEAKATVEQVRQLGGTLSRLSLDMLARAQILGEFPWSDKIRLRDGLKQQLRDLGLPEDEIEDADHTFHALLRLQHAHRVVAIVGDTNASNPDYVAAQGTLMAAFNYPALSVPSPDALRELVAKFISEDVGQALDDYERFEKTGQLRAMDMFDGETKQREKAARQKSKS